MNITVKNDGETVFCGTAKQFIADNENDTEVKEMVKECYLTGKAEQNFISGRWEVTKL